MPSLVQVLLGFVLLPILAGLLGIFTARGGADDLVNLITGIFSQVPVLGNMADAIATYLNSNATDQSRMEFISSLMNLSLWDVLAAASIGMWSGICFRFGKLVNIKGLPVIQSLFAVAINCILSHYATNYADHLGIILLFDFSLVLNIVLTIFTSAQKWLALLWGIGCEAVAGTFSAAYVVFLLMGIQGVIPNLAIWIVLELCMIIPLIFFLIMDYLVS